MKTPYQYKQEYIELLKSLSDIELIKRFNAQVGIRTWGIARQGYINALRFEIERRGIDFSLIGNENYLSFKYAVCLKDNKLYRIGDLPENEVQKLLQDYISLTDPFKTKFNLKISTCNNDQVKFGMNKHNGVLVLSSNLLLKTIYKGNN